MSKNTGFAMRRALRTPAKFYSVAVLMGFVMAPALADEPEKSDVEEVTVTGSRIVSTGFTQPTPTTSMTEVDIERSAEPNVFNTISKLPALQGSTGRATNTNSTS